MQPPKIFCFSTVVGGGEGVALAMAEDGTVLGSHFCSHESFVPGDLAVVRDGWMKSRHDDYGKHYPDGYEMEFVRAADVKGHAGLSAAFVLNQKQPKATPNAD